MSPPVISETQATPSPHGSVCLDSALTDTVPPVKFTPSVRHLDDVLDHPHSDDSHCHVRHSHLGHRHHHNHAAAMQRRDRPRRLLESSVDVQPGVCPIRVPRNLRRVPDFCSCRNRSWLCNYNSGTYRIAQHGSVDLLCFEHCCCDYNSRRTGVHDRGCDDHIRSTGWVSITLPVICTTPSFFTLHTRSSMLL